MSATLAVGGIKGVVRVDAHYLLGKVVVQYNANTVGARTIKSAIEALEYTAELWDGGDGGGTAGMAAAHSKLTH